jgi:hypothetical protein
MGRGITIMVLETKASHGWDRPTCREPAVDAARERTYEQG